MVKLFLALALCVVCGAASAADLGIALGLSGSGAVSGVNSHSVGGSISAGTGATAQGSGAAAGNTSFGATQLNGNNTAAQSGSIGFTAQGGFAASTGQAASANGNSANQAGAGYGHNTLGTLYLFAVP